MHIQLVTVLLLWHVTCLIAFYALSQAQVFKWAVSDVRVHLFVNGSWPYIAWANFMLCHFCSQETTKCFKIWLYLHRIWLILLGSFPPTLYSFLGRFKNLMVNSVLAKSHCGLFSLLQCAYFGNREEQKTNMILSSDSTIIRISKIK